jgi:hypothetical protein
MTAMTVAYCGGCAKPITLCRQPAVAPGWFWYWFECSHCGIHTTLCALLSEAAEDVVWGKPKARQTEGRRA